MRLVARALLWFCWLMAPALASGPPITAELSTDRVEISTGFTGASVLVFGATQNPLGGDPVEDLIVVATGPTQGVVVRRKINVLGIWLNGPSTRFPDVPGFYALAGTRRVWEILPEEERRQYRLGFDNLRLRSEGTRNPAFRAALLELKQADGRWQEYSRAGERLFSARIAFPATVQTGDYQIEVLLARENRVIARQELSLRVERVGTAADIASLARGQPLLYGVLCIVLAVLAGWLGSVLFRRN
jgi:uncharacterized protein (TIGR02186 family)